MFLTPETYYVIQDVSNAKRNLTIICEASTRVEAEDACRDWSACEVYKEQGEEIYRAIVEASVVKTVVEPKVE